MRPIFASVLLLIFLGCSSANTDLALKDEVIIEAVISTSTPEAPSSPLPEVKISNLPLTGEGKNWLSMKEQTAQQGGKFCLEGHYLFSYPYPFTSTVVVSTFDTNGLRVISFILYACSPLTGTSDVAPMNQSDIREMSKAAEAAGFPTYFLNKERIDLNTLNSVMTKAAKDKYSELHPGSEPFVYFFFLPISIFEIPKV